MIVQVGKLVEEADVWHGLAQVYTHLRQWEDAETCLGNARLFDSYSAATWHHTGEKSNSNPHCISPKRVWFLSKHLNKNLVIT